MGEEQRKLNRLIIKKNMGFFIRFLIFGGVVFSIVPSFWWAVFITALGIYLWGNGFLWGRERGMMEGMSVANATVIQEIAEGRFTQQDATKIVDLFSQKDESAAGNVDVASGVLKCPHCGTEYKPSDYRVDVPRIFCSACKAELPRQTR
jgi:hypothetical protein